MSPSGDPLRVATRASQLALWQAQHTADLLSADDSDQPVELVHVSTAGDRVQTESLRNMGSLGVFTREVQLAVLDGRADLAVHSLKDLPTDPTDGLVLAAVLEREIVFDALLVPEGASVAGLEALREQARIGTGSLRRQAQVRHQRPDVEVLDIRGNVETRIRKLDEGQYDAIVLAMAGLRRLGLEGRIATALRPPLMYPAVGQGAIGIECRADDVATRERLARIEHVPTREAVIAERALLAALRAGCHAPLGVDSQRDDDGALRLEAVVLSPDGTTRLVASARGSRDDPAALGEEVARLLRAQGADDCIATSRFDG